MSMRGIPPALFFENSSHRPLHAEASPSPLKLLFPFDGIIRTPATPTFSLPTFNFPSFANGNFTDMQMEAQNNQVPLPEQELRLSTVTQGVHPASFTPLYSISPMMVTTTTNPTYSSPEPMLDDNYLASSPGQEPLCTPEVDSNITTAILNSDFDERVESTEYLFHGPTDDAPKHPVPLVEVEVQGESELKNQVETEMEAEMEPQSVEVAKIIDYEQAFKKRVQAYRLTDFQSEYAASDQIRNTEINRPMINCPATNCNRSFTKASNAVFHFETHPAKVREGKVYCPKQDCPWVILGFRSRQTLSRHIACVHGNGAGFKCTTCGKKFMRKDGLVRHSSAKSCHARNRVINELRMVDEETSELELVFEANPVRAL